MNIIELLQNFDIPHKMHGEHHHTSKNFVQVDCPQCSKNSGRFRLGLGLNIHSANCYICGRLPFSEVLSLLTGQPTNKLWSLLNYHSQLILRKKLSHKGKLVIPNGVNQNLLPAHKNYLRSRGFSPREIQKIWQIGGIGIDAKLSWRIWIPITYQKEVVSWTTRSISNETKYRYISASEQEELIPHKTILYGIHLAQHHTIIIVEGPLDAWKIGPGAVATFGISYTDEQMIMASQSPIRVIVFDNEVKAQSRARQLFNDLASFPGKNYLVNLDAPDPGSASEKEIKLLRSFFQ